MIILLWVLQFHGSSTRYLCFQFPTNLPCTWGDTKSSFAEKVVLVDNEQAMCPVAKKWVAQRSCGFSILGDGESQPNQTWPQATFSRKPPEVSPHLSFSVICLRLNFLSLELLQSLDRKKNLDPRVWPFHYYHLSFRKGVFFVYFKDVSGDWNRLNSVIAVRVWSQLYIPDFSAQQRMSGS